MILQPRNWKIVKIPGMRFFQRIGGVEARAERNETRMGSLRSLLVKSMDEFISQSTGQENPDEEDRESAEEQRENLFKEISKEFAFEPSDKPDEIEESTQAATQVGCRD